MKRLLSSRADGLFEVANVCWTKIVLFLLAVRASLQQVPIGILDGSRHHVFAAGLHQLHQARLVQTNFRQTVAQL
jgi:hypothetical protein